MTTTTTGRWPWGSGRAPALSCSVCGRRIGLHGAHFLFEDTVLMCGRCTRWPKGSGPVQAERYPDCPVGWHDMWDHFRGSATRAAAWFVLTGVTSPADLTDLQPTRRTSR
jgi:hypothetical protein